MKNRRNFKNFYDIKPSAPLFERIGLGVIDGIIGILIMMYGITISSGALVDLRHFSIMISALFGGIPAAFITGLIIAISRFLFFDGTTYSTLLGAINAINMALVSGAIATFVHSHRKWLYMNLYCLASITIVAILLLQKDWYKGILPISMISIISAICIFYLINYLTESIFLQKKIKENDDKFRAITENISDIVSILNREGRTIYVSPSLNAYGIQPKDYEGKLAIDFIHPEDKESIHQFFLHCIENKENFKTDFRWLKPDGSYIFVEMSCTPIIEDKYVTSVVVVCRDITERKKIEKTLLYLSNKDGLTGVANRRYFDQKLKMEWEKAEEHSTYLSLIMFDIDYFKLYNDTYGHQAGDTCLQNIAAYIKELVRVPHLVARYGGEEFVVILINSDESQTRSTAKKIRTLVESLKIPHKSSKISDYVTVSVGCATLVPSLSSSKEELIHNADSALYQAKRNGKNRVESFYIEDDSTS